jgi:hypothetical protein
MLQERLCYRSDDIVRQHLHVALMSEAETIRFASTRSKASASKSRKLCPAYWFVAALISVL